METTTAKSNELEILPDLYQHVHQAMSDMEFYNDEIRFFRNLLDRYLIPLSDKESITKIEETAKLLTELEKQKDTVRRVLKGFIQRADDAIEEPALMTEEQLTELYLTVQEQHAAFIRSFRRFKKCSFAVMEHLLHTEKIQNLVS